MRRFKQSNTEKEISGMKASLSGKSSKGIIKYLFLIVGIVVIFMLYKAQLSKQEEYVTVVMTARDLQAGTVIDINTDMRPYQIKRSEYAKLNQITDPATKKPISPIVLKEEVEKLNNKYICNYTPTGTVMRRDMITSKALSVNPYIENLPEDGQYEIYTLPFDSAGVNVRMLLPGSNIRIRGVANIKNEFVNEVRELIEAKESKLDKGLPIPEDGKSVIRNYGPEANGSAGISTAVASDVPVAEIIFGNVKVADILNQNGESVLEILLALANKPLNERVALLRTSVEENEDGNTFARRISPSKLVLVVSREDASQLAEFENLGTMTFKYTILAESEDDGLYKQLRSVTDDIYSFVENYNAVAN